MTTHLRSMTGFAEAAAQDGSRRVAASVRSVNHRFLDLHAHLPEGFEWLETVVRRQAREAVRRGHVDVYVRVESAGAPEVRVNHPAAALYLKAIEGLKAEFRLQSEPDLGVILRLPGVVEVAAPVGPGETELVEQLLAGTLGEAFDRLNRMRQAEGARLAEEMAGGAERVVENVEKIEILGGKAQTVYLDRLRERIRDLVGQNPIDPGRLSQEAAQIAARSDATEETARLRSHIIEFRRVLEGPSEAGKKLDFLCQEMQREVNTTLAKAPALGPDGLEITRLALVVKAEIEKLREQVQNIE
ncbi:MAG TPA: YicC/YloC family endoribonuclease [Candidatus Dormibacteraeota bacterium]|nr:YicC/YloC family endoribonuclease [Candidatus Dormibacteraeota bacterium]